VDSKRFDQRESSASGFQILASSLPEMVEAMSRGSGEKKKKLGDITSRVARHLKAEICSIFLLDRYGKLLLEEAYGYDEAAIGTEKSLENGLTAKILNDKLTIVANFDVQDSEGWKGQLDGKLRGHCWCLLGVPIVGANNVVRGVIKVENRRRQLADQNTTRDEDDKSSISAMCTFLRAMASVKNTPEAICEIVEKLTQKTLNILGPAEQRSEDSRKLSILVEQTHLLANDLAKCRVSAVIEHAYTDNRDNPSEDASDGDLNNLESSTLEQRISSLRWYTEALIASIMRIMGAPPIIKCYENPSQDQIDVLEASRSVVALLQSLKLALDAYEPFGQEDLYLMRSVAAMIAAALDIREAAEKETLHNLRIVFRHAFKGDTAHFLHNVQRVSQKDFTAIPDLFRTALYISAQHDVFQTFENDTRKTITFEDLYKNTLLNRLYYYHDYLETAGKKFEFPEATEILDDLKRDKLLDTDTDAIVAALDIIIANAEVNGGKIVRLNILCEGNACFLIVSDDGPGFESERLSEIRGSWESRSAGGNFLEYPRGLLAAKWVLKKADMELEIGNNLKGFLKGAYAKIIILIQGDK